VNPASFENRNFPSHFRRATAANLVLKNLKILHTVTVYVVVSHSWHKINCQISSLPFIFGDVVTTAKFLLHGWNLLVIVNLFHMYCT
jgi:hypothetical protein